MSLYWVGYLTGVVQGGGVVAMFFTLTTVIVAYRQLKARGGKHG